jgi:hypothetical protein
MIAIAQYVPMDAPGPARGPTKAALAASQERKPDAPGPGMLEQTDDDQVNASGSRANGQPPEGCDRHPPTVSGAARTYINNAELRGGHCADPGSDAGVRLPT